MFLWRGINRQAAGAMLQLLGRGAVAAAQRPQDEAPRDSAGAAAKPILPRPAGG